MASLEPDALAVVVHPFPDDTPEQLYSRVSPRDGDAVTPKASISSLLGGQARRQTEQTLRQIARKVRFRPLRVVPSSSRSTREFLVACLRMLDVSLNSTKKVLSPTSNTHPTDWKITTERLTTDQT